MNSEVVDVIKPYIKIFWDVDFAVWSLNTTKGKILYRILRSEVHDGARRGTEI